MHIFISFIMSYERKIMDWKTSRPPP